jgi:hypothetical protein
MWAVNLDRFSWKGPNEDIVHLAPEEEEEKVVICKGCHQEIVEGEDLVESEYWENDYLHNLSECIERYYRKEKDPFAGNKRVI